MNNSSKEIKARFQETQEKVAQAVKSVGRNNEDVHILVVTKGQPLSVIEACIEAGICQFGENYPEESVQKISSIQSEIIKWHMIGHLQSRKVKIVAEYFDWMHSVDRVSLAQKLNNALVEKQKTLPILLEMNLGGEVSKSGWNAADEAKWKVLIPDIKLIYSLSNISVRGLMTMPPYTTNPEDNRIYFRKLMQLKLFLEHNIEGLNLPELSMGTSCDYLVGVEEGATFIRLGSVILGPRPPRKINE